MSGRKMLTQVQTLPPRARLALAYGVPVATVLTAVLCYAAQRRNTTRPSLGEALRKWGGAVARRLHLSGCRGSAKNGYAEQDGVDGIRPVSAITQHGYTKEELSKYDGVQNPRILISVKRKVYEVSPHFYGPGQDYHIFAGKEVSRCLAKSQISDKEANKYWVNCSEEELEELEKYVAKFDSKYPVVGWYIPDNSFYRLDQLGEE